jgi:hypothetical protein
MSELALLGRKPVPNERLRPHRTIGEEEVAAAHTDLLVEAFKVHTERDALRDVAQ